MMWAEGVSRSAGAVLCTYIRALPGRESQTSGTNSRLRDANYSASLEEVRAC